MRCSDVFLMYYFESQVIKSGLFIGLHEIYGNEYKDFMSKKLVLVVGDITRHNLGVQIIYDRYSHKVGIIISVAATTTFDERSVQCGRDYISTMFV